MAEYNLGRVAFFDKGVFSLTETYNKWDFVVTSDSTYLFIGETPQIGKPVTDTNFWKCIANGKPATLAAAAAEVATQAANTAATNADNARLAIAGDLALKEATANKQNSLAVDGTGTKFPTVDAVKGNFASQAEAEASTENTKFMTALRVFQNFVKNATTYVFSTLNTTSKTITGAINELFANKANKVQEAWITPTFINGASSSSFGYFKDELGIVHFRGAVSCANSSVAQFVLPVGYRPASNLTYSYICPASSNTTTSYRVDVGGALGHVIVYYVGAINISSITFRAES